MISKHIFFVFFFFLRSFAYAFLFVTITLSAVNDDEIFFSKNFFQQACKKNSNINKAIVNNSIVKKYIELKMKRKTRKN